MTDAREGYSRALAQQRRERRLARHQTPNPRRITDALDLAGLEGPEADLTLGVVEPAVDQWETGELVPTDEQLARLAHLAGVTVEWFYGPDPVPLAGGFICQRSGRGKGCHPIEPKVYPADRAALAEKVVPLHPDTLF